MKKKLAIVSTYDELCGIAGYTKSLVPKLENFFDVTVFDLDQMILRYPGSRMEEIGDNLIRDICSELSSFDAVNIQLEHGTLGLKSKNIFKRFSMLMESSNRVVITFHTIIKKDDFDYSKLVSLNLFSVFGYLSAFRKNNYLKLNIDRCIKLAQKKKRVGLVVHTRRDAKVLELVDGFENVFHHPLSYFSREEIENIISSNSVLNFPSLRFLPDGAKVIGLFGFIGEYKGIDVAIKALSMLDSSYHLVIFGGLHPSAIKNGVEINPVLKSLMDGIGNVRFDSKGLQALIDKGEGVNVSLSGSDLSFISADDLSDRVHFAVNLTDDQFSEAMCLSDIVVFPYLEVGQSASGPVSMANELGCNMICSRTKTFLSFARYHPGRIKFFDQGNYYHLAELLKSSLPFQRLDYPDRYNIDSNISTYLDAFGFDD